MERGSVHASSRCSSTSNMNSSEGRISNSSGSGSGDGSNRGGGCCGGGCCGGGCCGGSSSSSSSRCRISSNSGGLRRVGRVVSRRRKCASITGTSVVLSQLWLLLVLAPGVLQSLLVPVAATHGEADSSSSSSSSQTQASHVYMVIMREQPVTSVFSDSFSADPRSTVASVASLRGGTTSSASTSSGSGSGSRLHTAAARTYSSYLTQSHASTLRAAGVRETARVASYKYAVNGFGAVLTAEEAARVQAQAGVVSVQRSRRFRPRTTNSPAFLQLPSSLWQASGGMDSAGEDVIIGVVDGGIWPEHVSFSDNTTKPYGPIPAKWKGECTGTPDFPASKCNRKLIGAQYFAQGWMRETNDALDLSSDYYSARDADGHATWCASAAGGNSRVSVSLGGAPAGQMSGMAPRARIASYKVCWFDAPDDQWCSDADIVAALDKALADGVDVITMSLGFRGSSDFFGATESALRQLFLNGVIVSLSAGNNGDAVQFDPSPQTEYNAPWYLSVAASTTNQSSVMNVRLSNGVVVPGSAYPAGKRTIATGRLVVASACAFNPKSAESVAFAKYCLPNSLNPATCTGAVVVCTVGTNERAAKAAEVAAAGGAGMVLVSAVGSQSTSPEFYTVPGAWVTLSQWEQIKKYMASIPRLTATIEPKTQGLPAAPAMAAFSSRGPVVDTISYSSFPATGPSPHTLKPDITAPGVGLIGAYTGRGAATNADRQVMVMSGTSMAAPHVAGLAALLRQRWRSWSSARIKSVLMTTARVTDSAGLPIRMEKTGEVATPFAFGAGHVSPPRMLSPGLVYDVGQAEYYEFLAGINPTLTRYLPGVTWANMPKGIPGYQLNQPYICVARLKGEVNVTRRVTSVAAAPVTFTAEVVAPAGVSVAVMPSQLTLTYGATANFTVRLRVTKSSRDYKFGSLTWVSGGMSLTVRSVIVVQPFSL